MVNWFPDVPEAFHRTTAAFREAGVADGMLVGNHLSARRIDYLVHQTGGLAGDALVALAMVVGTHIEAGVLFTVVPADDLCRRDKRGLIPRIDKSVFLHLCQQPAAGDDGMCLEQLFGAGSTHLGGDHAPEVIFQCDDVDGGDALFFRDNLQRSLKTLVFPPFPVEVEADDHLLQFETVEVHILRFEGDLSVLFTLKADPISAGFHQVIS